MQSLMDHWDRFWASRTSANDFYPQHERIERAMRDIGPWKDCVVVEVGCGAGSAGTFLREMGARPVLLDGSQASMDKCRQRYPTGSGVDLIRGDAFRLPFKDGSVSLVFHQGLIEHFSDDRAQAILQENLRVLKPGGWLIVDVPQAIHPESFFARPLIWMGKWFAGWQTYYSIGRLRRRAQELAIEDIRYFGGWMNPSFFYRMLRWVSRPLVSLPLYPLVIRPVARMRHMLKERLFYSPLVLWTGHSIGFAGRKRGS